MGKHLYAIQFKKGSEVVKAEASADNPIKAFRDVFPEYVCNPTYDHRKANVKIVNLTAVRPNELYYSARLKGNGGR